MTNNYGGKQIVHLTKLIIMFARKRQFMDFNLNVNGSSVIIYGAPFYELANI